MSRRQPPRQSWAEPVVLKNGSVVFRARWIEHGRRKSLGSYDTREQAERVAAHFAGVTAASNDPNRLSPRVLVDRWLASEGANAELRAMVDADAWVLSLIRAFAPKKDVRDLMYEDVLFFAQSMRYDHEGYIPLTSCMLAIDVLQHALRWAAAEGLIGSRQWRVPDLEVHGD